MSGTPNPNVRRMKTYTGATGYVYQYYFVGKRPAAEEHGGGAEFIFDVTPDRKTMYATSIFLTQAALQAWSSEHGRALSDTEQYAAAKLRLFQAFDEIENIREYTRIIVDAAALEALLSTIGLD